MKFLKTFTDKDITPDQDFPEAESYLEREAARAIVFNAEGQVAIINVANQDCYKLPGGGINKGEQREEALKRECLEEIGCDIEITGEVGETYEIRSGEFKLKQKSYSYFAQVVGEVGKNKLDDYEIEDGMSIVWVPLAQALELVKNSKTEHYGYKFMVMRDSLLLEEARNLLESR